MEREDILKGILVRSIRCPDVTMKVLFTYSNIDLVKLRILSGDNSTRIGHVITLSFDEIKEEV